MKKSEKQRKKASISKQQTKEIKKHGIRKERNKERKKKTEEEGSQVRGRSKERNKINKMHS